MSIENSFNHPTENSNFLQKNTTEQKNENIEKFMLFSDDIEKYIKYTNEILNDDSKKVLQDEQRKIFDDKSNITYKRFNKDCIVAILDLYKDNKNFSCVIKNDLRAYDLYNKNIERAPDIKKYLPEIYSNVNNWMIIEYIDGIENEEVIEKLSKDEEFLIKYSKNIVDFIYTTATNNFITGDVVLCEANNVLVNKEDATFKLTEVDNIAPYPTPGYRGTQEKFNTNELILEQLLFEVESLTREARLGKTELIPMRANMLLQLFSNIFQKVNPEDLKNRYRYVEYPNIPFDEYGQDGIILNPKFVNCVENMNTEGATDFLLKKESITIHIPDTEENRIIV